MAARRFLQPWRSSIPAYICSSVRRRTSADPAFTPHLSTTTATSHPHSIRRIDSMGYSSSSYDWGTWRPLVVESFQDGLEDIHARKKCGSAAAGDKHHWLVMFYDGTDFPFPTEKALLDFYVEKLATVVGSEEEAKRKIYLVSSCGSGFGADIDEDTKNKLKGVHVSEDHYYGSRGKDFIVPAQFNLKNRNYRLDNIFSYHHLSKRSSRWKSDHWLINIKQPYGGFANIPQIIEYCVKVLAKALGSEEKAKEKIYMIWFKSPCGFAAEINEKTTKELEGLPDVLKVLPDYAFDVKDDDALYICPP